MYSCGHGGTEISPSRIDPAGVIGERYDRNPGMPVKLEYECHECQEIDALADLLLLVSYQVPRDVIRAWEPQQRKRIEEWASKIYIRASDNPVKVPTRPKVLDQYEWKPELENIIRNPPAGCTVSDLRTGKVIARGKAQ